jgi:hypothetical protein
MPRRRRSLLLVALATVALSATPATASNMGFALNLSWPSQSSPSVTWLSLPWRYTPTTSELLCQDLGGSAEIATVQRWVETTSTMVTYACGSGAGAFALVPGIAYGVRPQAWTQVAAVVVGAHDDAFAYSIAATSGSNLTFVSVPYHSAIPDAGGTPGVVDAEDLCSSVGNTLFAVLRWDATAGAWVAHACGSAFDTPFPLELATGYGLVNAAGQTIAWQPPHY